MSIEFAPAFCVISLIWGSSLGLPQAVYAQNGVPNAASAALPSYPIRMLTPAQAQADVALMRRALETIHPGLYRRTGKALINRAFARLERAARQPISDGELYRQASLVLAEIRCNHTKAEQPDAIEAWRNDNPSHLPFRFTLVQGRMIVVSADPNQSGLRAGHEIKTINGRTVAALVRALEAYVPIDGQTTWTRPAKLANDGDLMGSDFDHFYPYVFGVASSYRLGVVTANGARVQDVTLKPISFTTWQTLPNNGATYRQKFSETTSWRLLNPTTAYLSIATFVNYRTPVDVAQFYGAIFGQIKASGATRLILDLRTNGGGSDEAAYGLADQLLSRPYSWNKAIRYKTIRYGDLPDFINTWGDRDATFNPPMSNFTQVADGYDEIPAASPGELLPRTPVANGFSGPVTILTGPAISSATTMLISKLRDEGRVTLVGGRTGGSGDGPTSGQVFNVRLPNSGIVVRIPNAFNALQVTRFERDGGITPDVLVEPSVADVRAGRDRVLETAMAQTPRATTQPAQQDVSAIMARFVGNWTGTLEYRDYQSNGRVTLPTKMVGTSQAKGQQAKIAFTYDDGPGKTVFGGFTFGLDRTQGIVSKQEGTYAPDLLRAFGNTAVSANQPLTLIMWGQGTENRKTVDVRETLTLTSTTYRLLRETRPQGQGAFQFRHEYNFTRNPN
jgi:hypothetical protein